MIRILSTRFLPLFTRQPPAMEKIARLSIKMIKNMECSNNLNAKFLALISKKNALSICYQNNMCAKAILSNSCASDVTVEDRARVQAIVELIEEPPANFTPAEALDLAGYLCTY